MLKNQRVCNLWWTIVFICNAHQNIAGDVEHSSTSADNCCNRFDITTSLVDQNGVYERCVEEACNEKTIYHYKNGSKISTLIRDENTEHEWNIYKGSLYEAKDDSVVIYTGCKEDCPAKCNGTGQFLVHNYIKEVFEQDQIGKISCIENIESNYIGTWIAAIVIFIFICVALLVSLYFRKEILIWVREIKSKLDNGYSESKQEDVENPDPANKIVEATVSWNEHGQAKNIVTDIGSVVWLDSNYVLKEYPDILHGSILHQIPLDLSTRMYHFSIMVKENTFIYIAQDTGNRGYYLSDFSDENNFKRITDQKSVVKVAHDGRNSEEKLDFIIHCYVKVHENQDENIKLPSLKASKGVKMIIFTKRGEPD